MALSAVVRNDFPDEAISSCIMMVKQRECFARKGGLKKE
jgi:hypothetical protein